MKLKKWGENIDATYIYTEKSKDSFKFLFCQRYWVYDSMIPDSSFKFFYYELTSFEKMSGLGMSKHQVNYGGALTSLSSKDPLDREWLKLTLKNNVRLQKGCRLFHVYKQVHL